ncbi:MAG: hypothetical protein QNJ67_01640 [Kiloniellales bacterium]|nr:hypothetical protein [Kiloniellales bacterium]
MNRFVKGIALAAAILTIGGVQTATAEEERTVEATSPWISQGRYFKTGENEGLFIGVFAGNLFVKNAEGKLDTVALVCPGDFVIDLKSGAQEGEGKCIITDRDEDNVFANWTCEGKSFLGCQGEFTLTAGTGKFQGIEGSSPLNARTAFSEITVYLDSGKVTESAVGLLNLPKLTFTLP